MLPRDSSASDTLYNLFFFLKGEGDTFICSTEIHVTYGSFIDSCDTLVFTLQVLIVFPSFNCNFFKKYKNYINIYIVHTILHVVLYMHPIPCFFLLLIMSKLVI